VKTTQEFEQIAHALDLLAGHIDWKADKVSPLYDYQRIEARLENMRRLRESKDVEKLIHCLR
jgi:hypothetical protein